MSPEDTIAALERRLADAIARCDADACAALLHDEFTSVAAVEGGQLEIALRSDWMKAVAACGVRASTVDDVAVSLHGECAVAMVLWTDSEGLKATQRQATDIWMRTGATDWRLAERHAGRPAPRSG